MQVVIPPATRSAPIDLTPITIERPNTNKRPERRLCMMTLRSVIHALIPAGRWVFPTSVSLCTMLTVVIVTTGSTRQIVADPGAAAPPPASSPAAKLPASSSADELRAARKLFSKSCAKCHEEDGQGREKTPSEPAIPDFGDRRWQAKRTDSQLLVTILDGKGASMPAFHGKIPDGQARTLVGFIRALGSMPRRPAQSQTDDFPKRFDEFVRTAEKMPRRPGPEPADDFSRRMAELQKELDDLRKQYRELADPRPKP
jgi:mono/diheme cytochrome c family protein